MSSPLKNLEQQYAAEVVKVDADEKLLKRLERGIWVLKGVAEPAGQVPSLSIPWFLKTVKAGLIVASAFSFSSPTASQSCLLFEAYRACLHLHKAYQGQCSLSVA